MYTRRNVDLASFFYALSAFISCLLVLFLKTTEKSLLVICIFGIVELLAFIILNGKKKDGFLSFSNIFVVCLFVFHFGQLVLLTLFPNSIMNLVIKLKYFSTYELLDAMKLIYFSYSFFLIGILLPKGKKTCDCQLQNTDSSFSIIKRVSGLFIILFFPFKFLVDSIFVLKSFSTSYEDRLLWYTSFPDFFITVINMSMIGFAGLVLAYRDNPKKQNALYIFVVAYLLVIMLGGRRSENVSYLVITTLLFLVSRKKRIRLFTWIILLLLLFLFSGFLFTIVGARNASVKNISEFFSVFRTSVLEHNILFEVLREYGNTGYTAVCVLEKRLQIYSPSWGQSYYLGLSSILPNITGLPGKLAELSNYGKQLQMAGTLDGRYINIGGSIIGEVFYNFGRVGGLFLSLFWGYVIGIISRRVSYYLRVRKYNNLIYYVPVMFSVLFWVRSYFCGLTREIVWSICACFFFSHLKVRIGFRYKQSVINVLDDQSCSSH